MKKFFYILVAVVALATSFTACTDENVKPQTTKVVLWEAVSILSILLNQVGDLDRTFL